MEIRKSDLKGQTHEYQMNSSCLWMYTKIYSPGTFGHSEPRNETVHTWFLESELLPL